MKIWKSVALVLMGLGRATQPARAAESGSDVSGRRERGPHGMGPERMVELLGLTDEQRASWQQMREEFHAALEPLFEQQRAAAEKLQQALASEQPDALTVGKLVIALHQQRRQTEQQHEALQQRLRATLSPEQQVKFDVAQALRPHGRADRGFGPGGPGFGPGTFGPGHPRGPRGDQQRPGRGSRPQGPGF
jgi:Spy/CpxP family protein refolding chaperone